MQDPKPLVPTLWVGTHCFATLLRREMDHAHLRVAPSCRAAPSSATRSVAKQRVPTQSVGTRIQANVYLRRNHAVIAGANILISSPRVDLPVARSTISGS